MNTIFATAEEKMNKSLNNLVSEFASIRAGRANPGVLDKLSVDYYGSPTPINQVAAVSVPDPRTLMIAPWDKSVLKEIEKAILTSDIGINPQNDGTSLRLIFPPMTEERRKELTKDIAKMGEDCKVAIRSIRRDAIDKIKDMKKKSEITEDDQKNGEKKMQDLTDRFAKEADKLTEAKQKEIMEI
ncbi:MAG: ribosome recycling factor [Ruminococcaceae bacterium]|nr:ribosome recycling factor [Oscillospiraceae bacterium]